MPAYEDSREITIDAPPAAVFAVLTDYAHMPEWQSRICECRVLETDDADRGRIVQYAIDAKLRVVRYRLRHLYDEPSWIGSEYVGGDFREFGGDYHFAAANGHTDLTFRLKIDPGFRVPGAVARMLGPAVMGRSLQDFKRRVEEEVAARGPK
jgi:ribosome-associated toxin RatA of RatAB toxin-antitoxin module